MVSEKLAKLRRERGLSQTELAEALRISRQAVSRWENGTALPSVENLLAMRELYHVSLDELVSDWVPCPASPEAVPDAVSGPEPETGAMEKAEGVRLRRAVWPLVLSAALLLAALVLFAAALAFREKPAPRVEVMSLEGLDVWDLHLEEVGRSSFSFGEGQSGQIWSQSEEGFRLEAGGTFTVKGACFPLSAGVRYGFVDPEGLFHGVAAENGILDYTFTVERSGTYYFAWQTCTSEMAYIKGYIYF